MAKKRKAADENNDDDVARARKCARNRASPIAVVKLYDFIEKPQRDAVTTMEFDSLLDIKCHFLNNPLITWFAGLYDTNSREFVIPGRGRIPLNEDSVYRTLGLPLGDEPVIYRVDSKIEAELGPKLFPGDGNSPLTTRVFEILKEMKAGDVVFKQIFVMYIVSTILSPTTRNRVSNRCYPIMVSFPLYIFVCCCYIFYLYFVTQWITLLLFEFVTYIC